MPETLISDELKTVSGRPAATGAARRRGWLLALWRELRPKQWVKNLFVFAPIFFSAKAFSLQVVTQTLLAFGCFCAVSSSVYLLNDLVDRAQDRLHPEKRHRPLAAGLLNVWIARIAAAGLLIPALSGGMALSRSFAMVLAAYWALNVLYAWRLKQAVILDVFVVAAGYLLRVMAGAVVIQAVMSRWLLICTTLLALFIALCKRRHELVLLAEGAPNHRHVLTDYPIPFLDAMIGIITASALVSYTLYTVSEEIVAKFGSQGLLVTAPFVLYGFFRYLYLVYHKAEGGDPTQSILTDRPMMVNLGLWAATAGVILYGKG
ncbi:MAG TPA: decaprenyl-phosphate phosphoribosyltransferase [Candidatus Omnitrophica bacterium]|nr:decaprenyl-phosphate phosphoribosyltransferase [Candidatus Omnitrophota bacterium]